MKTSPQVPERLRLIHQATVFSTDFAASKPLQRLLPRTRSSELRGTTAPYISQFPVWRVLAFHPSVQKLLPGERARPLTVPCPGSSTAPNNLKFGLQRRPRPQDFQDHPARRNVVFWQPRRCCQPHTSVLPNTVLTVAMDSLLCRSGKVVFPTRFASCRCHRDVNTSPQLPEKFRLLGEATLLSTILTASTSFLDACAPAVRRSSAPCISSSSV